MKEPLDTTEAGDFLATVYEVLCKNVGGEFIQLVSPTTRQIHYAVPGVAPRCVGDLITREVALATVGGHNWVIGFGHNRGESKYPIVGEIICQPISSRDPLTIAPLYRGAISHDHSINKATLMAGRDGSISSGVSLLQAKLLAGKRSRPVKELQLTQVVEGLLELLRQSPAGGLR